MERLTKRDIDGCLIHPWSFNGINGSYDIWDEDLLEKQIDRLAAYEDTGLEPEEIYEVRFLIAAQRDPQKLARLRELVLADQDGRLVVLPCKVGDAVYWFHNDVITECRVHRVQMNRTGLFICLKSKVSHGAFRVDICLGKTVFLTREEAEAALAQEGENDGN